MGFKNKEKLKEIAYIAGYTLGSTIFVSLTVLVIAMTVKIIWWML